MASPGPSSPNPQAPAVNDAATQTSNQPEPLENTAMERIADMMIGLQLYKDTASIGHAISAQRDAEEVLGRSTAKTYDITSKILNGKGPLMLSDARSYAKFLNKTWKSILQEMSTEIKGDYLQRIAAAVQAHGQEYINPAHHRVVIVLSTIKMANKDPGSDHDHIVEACKLARLSQFDETVVEVAKRKKSDSGQIDGKGWLDIYVTHLQYLFNRDNRLIQLIQNMIDATQDEIPKTADTLGTRSLKDIIEKLPVTMDADAEKRLMKEIASFFFHRSKSSLEIVIAKVKDHKKHDINQLRFLRDTLRDMSED